jgi:uncharacterized protein (TIGR02118 family)
MFKVIALIAHKPGLSRAEFVAYYESNHAPLAARIFPQFIQYRRNYVQPDGAIMAPGMPDPDFDSVTEIWYRDRDSYDEMLNSHFSAAHQQFVEEDERKFMDQSLTRFFIVDERGAETPDAELGSAAGGMFKVMALLTRKAGMKQDDFVAYYETRHSRLIRSLFPWIVEYRRNFIDMTGAILGAAATAPDFDVVTELWFKDRADYDRMLAAHARPEIGGAIAADEENCFDRSKTRFFVVDERGGPLPQRAGSGSK